MKDAIRWAVCLVMAATFTPAFAHPGVPTGDLDDGATRAEPVNPDEAESVNPIEYDTSIAWVKADANSSESATNDASGEPRELHAADRANGNDAVQAWADDEFLQEVWRASP